MQPRLPRSAPPTATVMPPVPPVYARLLHLLLQRQAGPGVDTEEVLIAAALDAQRLLTDDRPLPRSTVITLVQAAVAATGQPWLGLDLGQQAPVTAHGALGYAAVTARNLGQSLAVLARHGQAHHQAFAWTLQASGDGGAVLRADECGAWGPARGFVLDTALASVLTVIQAAVGALPAGLQVDLPLPEPAWSAAYARRWPDLSLRFGQAALAFHLDAAALRLPCVAADARAHTSACDACAALQGAGEAGRLREQVAALLAAAPSGRYPALAEVAAACGLGPRTLMRRLQAEDSSFQALLDDTRRARAASLLQHTPLSVEAVATALGFADPSNFSRTVRRWVGLAPQAWRQQLRACGQPAGPTASGDRPSAA